MSKPTLRTAIASVFLLVLIVLTAWAATLVGTNGTFKTTVTPAADNTKKDGITIEYTPDPTKITCDPIYLVQTCRDVDQTGTLIEPKNYVGGAFVHLQPDMTPGGTYVDHMVCEKDGYYNGEDAGKDVNSKGSSNGVTSKPTSMYDAPGYSDAAFPAGVTKIVSTFEVCAICKATGKILDCITWTYTRTKGDADRGKIADATAVGAASAEFKDALKLFDANHKNGTICPDAEAEKNKDAKNVKPGTNKKLPVDTPTPGQPFQVMWSIVNSSGVDVDGVDFNVFLDGHPLTGGSVGAIEHFDRVQVFFSCPPLPLGVHQLTMVVDPGNLLPEYDETDNAAVDYFGVGTTGVPQPGTGTIARLAVEPLWPQTGVGSVRMRLQLPSAGAVKVELLDISGRRVASAHIESSAAGSRDYALPLRSTLQPGSYVLRLTQGGAEAAAKIVVVR